MRLRCAVFRRGIIQILLGNQTWSNLVGVDQPFGVGMERDVVGLGSRYVAVRALNLFFGMMNGGLGLVYLRHQFGNLEDSQHLALTNMITDIHIDILDVAGNLGVQLDVLVRAELACDGKRCGNGRRLTGATAA